ncbi:clamp loader small subunit [Aeromonas phage ZPAH1]|nr:clamp loader small subunit [Aeromonas phage Aswh_1]QQG33973.1 clamp loader small subunit [Aeromonas phage ZPAH1]
MSLEFLGLETPNEHRLAWDAKDWARVKELSKEFKEDEEKALYKIIKNVTEKTGYKNVLEFSSYDQYSINRALSYHPTMNGYASELNMWAGNITDQMHYDYLYHTITKCKLPFVKPINQECDYDHQLIVKVLARHYNVSDKKASEFIELHDEKELNQVKKEMKCMINSPDCEFLSFLPNKSEKARLYKVASKW